MIFMEVTYEQTGHGNGRDRRRPYPLRPGKRADIFAAEGTYRRQGGGISSRAPWSLFEVQDVVYEVLTANDADAELRTWVLQELLGEN